MLKIGITGGIGSGKTTACLVFAALGVPVYDSDLNAKRLMNGDRDLAAAITGLFGPEAYGGNVLDTKYVASRVFTDRTLLARHNALVHPYVMAHFDRWCENEQRNGAAYVIQENAILFEGGFDRGMDYSVTVSAPLDERVRRAAARSGIRPADVRARVGNQMDDKEREGRADHILHNGEYDLLLPQILKLHRLFSERSNER